MMFEYYTVRLPHGNYASHGYNAIYMYKESSKPKLFDSRKLTNYIKHHSKKLKELGAFIEKHVDNPVEIISLEEYELSKLKKSPRT